MKILALLCALFAAIYGVFKKFGGSKDKTIEDQQKVIDVLEAKDEINKEDQKIDSDTSQKITDIEKEINGKSDQDAAKVVSDNINDYFGDKK